jgi:adenylate cyclase
VADKPSLSRIATLAGVREVRLQKWHEAGLFERVTPQTDAWVARCHVLAELERARVPLNVLVAADRSNILERAYFLDFLQQLRTGKHLRADVVRDTGLTEDLLLRMCDSLGIDDSSVFTDDELLFLTAIAEAMRQGLPEPMVLETCELWGAYMRYIAAAEVVSYDTNLARRLPSSARSPLELAALIAPLTRALLKATDLLPGPLHRRHLLQALDLRTIVEGHEEALEPGEIDITMGFVDLSGFTALTEEEGDRQALVYARRLERLMRRESRAGGPRIVKRLGDGLMIASPTVFSMLPAVIRVVEATRERQDMPSARAGIAFGRVQTRAGDFFGHAVNVAARLLAEAQPSEVLVTEEVVEEAGSGPYIFRNAREIELHGIREPVRVWRAEGVKSRAQVDG